MFRSQVLFGQWRLQESVFSGSSMSYFHWTGSRFVVDSPVDDYEYSCLHACGSLGRLRLWTEEIFGMTLS
jgi:hypothetical protein